MSLVLLVFQTLTAWGKKAKVVQNAAKKPIYFNIKFKTIIFQRGVLLPGALNQIQRIPKTLEFRRKLFQKLILVCFLKI